ncbi:MAG: site-2 protease family protein [Sphingomonadaceae bacterium]|nr:site-2 protease family protein [Sphingomonadaceae bacterium]
MNETITLAIVLIPSLVIAIVFHEVAHGWVANLLGDPTAKQRNRLSLNPIRHVDLVGTVILPGVLAMTGAPVFGWAKPVPVVKQRLNNPRYGMMAVAAAGPGTNLILAAIGAVLLGLLVRGLGAPPEGGLAVLLTGLNYFIIINIFLALFNLLPIPPFDGSHIVEGLLPHDAARAYNKLRPFGFPMLFILLLVLPWLFPGLGIVERIVVPPVEWAREQFMRLAFVVAGG